MALRDKLRDRTQQYLEPGEQTHAVLMAQTGPSPWFSALSALIVLFGAKYYIVVVTDRSLVVLRASIWIPSKPKEFHSRLPRDVRMGGLSGVWAKTFLLGEKTFVHKRFHKDLEQADQALAAMGRLTPDTPSILDRPALPPA